MVKLLLAERLRDLPKTSQLGSGKMLMQAHLSQVQASFHYATEVSYKIATSVPKMALWSDVKENTMGKNIVSGVSLDLDDNPATK